MSMVLIEPAIVDRDSFTSRPDDRIRVEMLMKAVATRKDEWDSPDAAYEWLAKRQPWKTWDSRALRLYAVRHAFLLLVGTAALTRYVG